MKMPVVYYFINGINTFPGLSKNWNGKAVTGIHKRLANTTAKAEKIEYFTMPFSRVLANNYRAEKLLKVNEHYGEFRKIVVAHSNGADVILDALRLSPFKIDRLILISAAVTDDCGPDGNRINILMDNGLINILEVWIGKKDIPLRLGKTGIGRLFGYGSLGLDGPDNFEFKKSPRYIERVKEDYGHSTWFDDENIEGNMDYFASLELAA